MGVTISGDLDADPATPDTSLETGFSCESESNLQIVGTDIADFDLAEGPITVVEDSWTIVVNIFSSLDIYVRDDVSNLPIAGAEVCLYEDAAQTMLIGCETTDGTGIVRFFFVGDLLEDATFTVNSEATGYEQEATTFEYSLLTDIEDGNGLVDDATTADVIQSLDPDELNFGIVDVLLTFPAGTPPAPVASGGTIAVYSAAVAPATDVTGQATPTVFAGCGGTLLTEVSTTDGAMDFGLAPGNYCFEGDANGDGLPWVAIFTVAVPNPNVDQFVVAPDVALNDSVLP
jgi:hypothetical protein